MNKVTLLLVALTLCSCIHSGQKVQPSDYKPLSGALEIAQTQTQKSTAIAKSIATNGTKPGSKESSELLASLSTTQEKQKEEELLIQTLSTEDKQKTEIANQNASLLMDANLQLREAEPKHKRDISAIFIGFWAGCLFCFAGPFIRAAYPPLMLIPASLASIASSIAGGLVCALIAGLLLLFGVL